MKMAFKPTLSTQLIAALIMVEVLLRCILRREAQALNRPIKGNDAAVIKK
jgi:hypothetical protein